MLLKNITTVDNNFNIIENANIIIEDGRIKVITNRPPSDYSGSIYDGEGKLALPGFYNMHCHVPMGLLRGFGEGLPLDRWLNERVFPFEDLLSGEDMYWGALLGTAEMISAGVVSFTDMYMEMPHVSKAVEESGLKANLSHGTTGFGEETSFFDTNGYAGTNYLVDRYPKLGGRIIANLGIHGEYTSTEKVLREAVEYGKRHGLQVHLHLSETEKEHNDCKKRHGGLTPTQWFESVGILELGVTAAHCCWVEDGDIEILKKYDVTVVHCPSSNLKLGSGFAPIKKLLKAGVRVCIGTDGSASNNNLNMLEEIHLTALLHKGVNYDPQFLSSQDILKMATINGAVAQGRQNAGRIEAGCTADIIVFDLNGIAATPCLDILSNVIFSMQASDICLNIIEGKVVYENGKFLTLNIETVKKEVRRIATEKAEELLPQ